MHPPAAANLVVSRAQAASAFWDEPTLVAPDPRRMQLKNRSAVKKKRSSSPLSKAKGKAERFHCVYGCSKKFVNQAELRNHVEILHQTDQNAFQDPNLPYPSETDIQQVGDIENSTIRGEVIQHQLSKIDEQQTVKPVRVTAAALEALNLNDELPSLRATDEESTNGSDIEPPSVSEMSIDTTYSALEHADESAESDVADPEDQRIKVPVRILLILWSSLLRDFSGRKKAAHRQHGQYNGPYSQSGSPSGSSPFVSSSSSIASGSRRGKRKKGQDEEEEDSESRRRAPSSRASHGRTSPDNVPLACPFNKFDSHIFGADGKPAYHICTTWHDVKTAYLKQHLLRNHCLPQHHCIRCGKDFKNDSALYNHHREPNPCPLNEIDNQKMKPDIQLQLGLRTRNAPATDRFEYWNRVYDTIFGPEDRQNRQVDPCYKGPSHDIIQAFLQFSEPRMSQILRQTRQSLQISQEDYNEHNVELVRTILQEASQAFIAGRQATERQSLPEMRARHSGASDDEGERTVVLREKSKSTNQPDSVRAEPASHASPSTSFNMQQRQPSNVAAFQQTPLPTQFAQGQTFNLPDRSADDTLPPQQPDISGFDFATPFDDAFGMNFNSDQEFLATCEDTDMYSGHSVNMNNLEGYDYYNGSTHSTS